MTSDATTYKLIEIVGTSDMSIDGAVANGLSRAARTIRGIAWLQIGEIRARVDEGSVDEYQVIMKIGVKLDSDG